MKIDNYDLETCLGKGAFGEVYLTSRKGDPKKYATKKLDREEIESGEGIKYLRNEIVILQYLNHPNIVKFQEVKKTKKHYYIIMEYCNGGELSKALEKYVNKYGKPFPEELVQHFMRQIISAFKYIHERKIIHRDVKLDNILLHFENEEDLKNFDLMKATVKIIDFGFACKISKTGLQYTVLGSPINMDPIILKKLNSSTKKTKQLGYSEKADIWSIGTICYEMVIGRPVYDAEDMDDLVEKVEDGSYKVPTSMSHELVSFLNAMLQYNSENRLTASQLSRHDFIVKDVKDFKKIDLEKVAGKVKGDKLGINSIKKKPCIFKCNTSVENQNNIHFSTKNPIKVENTQFLNKKIKGENIELNNDSSSKKPKIFDIKKVTDRKKKEIKETKNCLNDIFAQIIGKDLQFESPIKDENNKRLKKFIIYTDYTASGKSIKSIESFIKHQVLPTYANVHSTVGLCAEMTSKYLQEAKDNLRKYTNSFGNYSIIFHGQGATGGVHKLIELLGIKKYESFYDKLKMAFDIKAVYGNDIVKTLKNNLIKEIKEQFKELFINTNFCNKIKDKESEKYKLECILCKQYFENEGHYHKHIQEKSHQKFLKDYEENPSQEALFEIKGRRIKDFIDIIKTKYNVNSEKSILELINDYERFKPVVFYSLFEHNSNSLSWRETQCKIVLIDGDYNNFYDNLESKLTENEKYYIKIGSFTASSNITGLLLDVDKIASIIHNKQGFAFFDYAAAAPYLKIDMQEALPNDYRKKLKFDELDEYDKRFCYKDGLFFSPHKFVGGKQKNFTSHKKKDKPK